MTTSSIFNEMSQTAHVGPKGCACMLVAKSCLTLCNPMGPARLLCPWDSPGKNTAACSVTKSCLTLCDPHGWQPTRLLCPWDFPSKNTGVGGHFLLQAIFPTQGLNPHPLHWQADFLYHCAKSTILYVQMFGMGMEYSDSKERV